MHGKIIGIQSFELTSLEKGHVVSVNTNALLKRKTFIDSEAASIAFQVAKLVELPRMSLFSKNLKVVIYEALKNSHDSIIDRQLLNPDSKPAVIVSWSVNALTLMGENANRFTILIADNGAGSQASISETKRTDRNMYGYVGGHGRGLSVMKQHVSKLSDHLQLIELKTDQEGAMLRIQFDIPDNDLLRLY